VGVATDSTGQISQADGKVVIASLKRSKKENSRKHSAVPRIAQLYSVHNAVKNDMKLVSTRQAATLLGVHESSIKRWCNSEELPCSHTAGGHRRIDLTDVLTFARKQHLECSLLPFGADALMVWNGANELRLGRQAEVLAIKMRDWLLHAESQKLSGLMLLCRSLDIPYARLFDRLIARVMEDIGEEWSRGSFDIGDEHRISESLMDVLYSLMSSMPQTPPQQNGRPVRRAIVGCGPQEDHATGAMMVRILLMDRGWKVIYLGRNVPEEDIVLYQRRHRAELVAVSMSSHQTTAALREFVRNVTSLRRDDVPFDLAIGGSAVNLVTDQVPSRPSPVVVRTFEDSESFVDWLDVRHEQ